MTTATPNRATLAAAFLALSLSVPVARAEEPSAGVIKDNSFLIEEAYNQERGVVQHISTFARGQNGGWLYTFTQEWPMPDERHQLSFTLPVQRIRSEALRNTGVGDAALNYRYGAVGNDRLAFAPRLSLLVPTGRSRDSLGAGGTGLQLNLPASVSIGRKLVTHWNAGLTHTFDARDAAGEHAGLTAYTLGQSLVFLAHPRVNLLVETLWARSQAVAGPGSTSTSDALVISPGIRFAHDFKSGLQLVPGLAYTVGVGPSRGQHAVFLYLSLEHSFRGPAR